MMVPTAVTRRGFLRAAAASSFGLAFSSLNTFGADGKKKLEGIFPIMQTPFTDSDGLDLEALARQVKFLDRVGVHGMVWPQLASEYFDLTVEERFKGAEAVMEAAKGTRPAIVIGVQGPDTEAAVRYARHADKLAPDAVIALPPRGVTDLERVLAYYRAVGGACSRPLFVQSIGEMSVDFVLRMAREIPTLRFVKDEAGQTLPRITEYRAKGADLIDGVFTGAHGRTLLDELARGSSGTMPASPFVDLYVQTWDLWHAKKRSDAIDRFSKVMLMVSQVQAYGMPSLKYLLELRGVFKNHRCRSEGAKVVFDDQARRSLRETYEFIRPLLKA
jgi:2-keto-3-deoxy-L-arabinonate dehydratase